MMQLLFLGAGCAKCARLYDLTAPASQGLGLEHELQKVGPV